ncbi:MAG: hypothetical protein ACSHX3_15810 [Litorimonas sp.]
MKHDRLDRILAGPQSKAQKSGRELTDGERVALVKDAGKFPEDCGPAPKDAPARGALRVEVMMASYPKGEGEFEAKRSGWRGRRTAHIADVFDVMAARGKQRFTPSQLSTARAYRFMVERHAAGGMRCASLEAAPSGGGGAGGGEWIDAFVDEGDAIRAMERRIGQGVALDPERAGMGRSVITDRALVKAVCLEELSLSEVLRRHGWKLEGRALSAAVLILSKGLGAALDRMGRTAGMGRIVAFHEDGFTEGVKKSLGDALDK